MKTISCLLVALSLMALSGCNTVRGIGQDIGKAGSAIEKSAK
ncbi:entericidin [Limnohabitans sp. 2KL-17]|jgi:predicted small secreted protein|nr:entericidin A/B family lipoprotein [Limnohabitans sp. 2KL-17]PUE54746.1 entericidin [Limnohabitans sp. 2KL-17]